MSCDEFGWCASRVELAETAIRGYPIVAGGGLYDVVDGRVRQALVRAVGGECVAVEACESFIGTKPQEAARIAHDLVNDVVRQPVSGCISLKGQPLAPRRRPRSQQQCC